MRNNLVTVSRSSRTPLRHTRIPEDQPERHTTKTALANSVQCQLKGLGVDREGGKLGSEVADPILAKQGSGRALSAQRRHEMEKAFGASFGEVRVHDDEESAILAATLGARAFTIGNDIFFHKDVNADDTNLLAHELTHVVQQQSTQTTGELEAGSANDQFEQEANEMARKVVAPGNSKFATPNADVQLKTSSGVVQRGGAKDTWEDVKYFWGEGQKAGEEIGKWVFGDPMENIAETLGEDVPGKMEEAPKGGEYVPGPTSGSDFFDELISGDFYGIL